MTDQSHVLPVLDRSVAALSCCRAATLMTLKRALRNRFVSADHSLSPEDKLIPLLIYINPRVIYINPRARCSSGRRQL